MGADKSKAMQVLQTVLVAMLLGVLSWLSLSTVSSRDRLLKLETQLEERGPRITKLENDQDQVLKTQQEVLRTLVDQKASMNFLSRRLDLLEKKPL